jgi:hypothetical protein
MKYTKSLTGGIIAARVAGLLYFALTILESYEHTSFHFGGVDSFTISLEMPGPGALLLLALAFLAGFLLTMVITSRQNDA